METAFSRATCPCCQAKLKLKHGLAQGTNLRCPQCQKPVTIGVPVAKELPPAPTNRKKWALGAVACLLIALAAALLFGRSNTAVAEPSPDAAIADVPEVAKDRSVAAAPQAGFSNSQSGRHDNDSLASGGPLSHWIVRHASHDVATASSAKTALLGEAGVQSRLIAAGTALVPFVASSSSPGPVTVGPPGLEHGSSPGSDVRKMTLDEARAVPKLGLVSGGGLVRPAAARTTAFRHSRFRRARWSITAVWWPSAGSPAKCPTSSD